MVGGADVPIVWRGRRVQAFVPQALAERDLALDARTASDTATATAALTHAAERMPPDHAALARLLLRSEGVASSFIEGVAAPVVDIVLGTVGPAAWVAANLAAVADAVHHAATAAPASLELLLTWHRVLMTGSPTPARHVGAVRDEQGLAPLLTDMLTYVNRDDVDPIAQAAVAHAQFELLHPFADGNGRLGRILVAWLLTRRLRLLVPPPVSTAIAADVGGYTAGLTLFRLGEHRPWIRWFATAVTRSGRAQQDLVEQVATLRVRWEGALRERTVRAVRSDALAWPVLDLLPRMLVLTAPAVAAGLAVTGKAAGAALRTLADVGVLTDYGPAPQAGPGRPSRLYVSVELLGLVGSNPGR